MKKERQITLLVLLLFIFTLMLNIGLVYELSSILEIRDKGMGTMEKPLLDEGRASAPHVISPANKIARIAEQITHGPITLSGDGAFTSANGVSAGTGTEQDPYIIANWFIDGSGNICIRVEDTTKYFIIENCTLINATGGIGTGISLLNVANCHLRSNECNANTWGIYFHGGSSNTLTNNTCNGNSNDGIMLFGSSSNTLINNTCNNNGWWGISSTSSGSSNILMDNTCNNNLDMGIRLSGGSNHTLRNNICHDNTNINICLYFVSSSTLTTNFCKGGLIGIYYEWSSSNTMTNNICSGNDYGIELVDSSSNTITANVLSNNTNYGIGLFVDTYESIDNIITSNWIWDNGDNTITGSLAGNYIAENNFPPLPSYYDLNDPDYDGLTNTQELAIGTSLFLADTDGDNFIDGYEYAYGSDPLNSSDYPTPPTVNITSPLSTTYDQASVTLTYTVSEGTVTIYTNGIANSTAQPSGNLLSDLVDGTYTITIIAWRGTGEVHGLLSGYMGIATVTFIIDSTTTTTPATTTTTEETTSTHPTSIIISTSVIYETLTTWVTQSKSTAEFATLAIFAGIIGVVLLKRRKEK